MQLITNYPQTILLFVHKRGVNSLLCGRFGIGGLGGGALGGVALGSGGVGGGSFLFAVFRHENVVEAVLLMEFAEVHITPDAADATRLGMLPEGVANRGGAMVVGYEDVVGAIAFAGEVFVVDLLASVYHGLGAVFLLH